MAYNRKFNYDFRDTGKSEQLGTATKSVVIPQVKYQVWRPYDEVDDSCNMGQRQSDCNKSAFDKDIAGSLPNFESQPVVQTRFYRRRSSSIDSVNVDQVDAKAAAFGPSSPKHASSKTRSNNWLLDALKFRRSQDSSDSDCGFAGPALTVPVNEKSIKRKSIHKKHGAAASDNAKNAIHHRSPNFAHRLRNLMTRSDTNALTVNLNSDKSYSDSDLFGFNHLHPKLQATSSTESDISVGKRHSINSLNVGSYTLSSISQPSIATFADALNSAPRFRLAANRGRSQLSAKPDNLLNANDASTVGAAGSTFKKMDAVVFVSADSEIKCGSDYEMFYVEKYKNHLLNVANNCHVSSEYFSDLHLIIQHINTVTKDALKIKQVVENRAAGRRKQRSFSVDYGFGSATSTQDVQRCNTPSNVSAVLLRLRSPSKKSRSNSICGLQALLPGCTVGLVDHCQVLMIELIKGKAKQKSKSRHLLLFTDRILIFKTKKEQIIDQLCINLVWVCDSVRSGTTAGSSHVVDSALDNSLILGWPMVNYSMRFESAKTCLLWRQLLDETIEQSRAKDADKPSTLPIQIVLDYHKDVVQPGETLGSIRSIEVGPTDNADYCLQCALLAFNMTENYSLTNTQLIYSNNSAEVKLMGHEIPYWIMLGSMHRYQLASDGPIIIDSHDSRGRRSLSRQMSSANDEDLNDESGKIKFLLRHRKLKSLQTTAVSEVAEDLTKSKLKSRKGLSQLLGKVGKSKSEELDDYEAAKTLKTNDCQVFGRSLNDICPNGVIGPAIMGLLGYVYAHIPSMEGPFRVTGNFVHIKQLQSILDKVAESNSNVFLNALFELKNVGCPSPATVLGLLKKFCANVPDQVLQKSQIKHWMEACRESNVEARLTIIKKILQNLPSANARLLELLLCICVRVVKHTEITKLNASGLSTSLGPSLLTPLDPVDVDAQYQINELFGFLITHFETLWPNSDACHVLKAANPSGYCDDSSIDSIEIENEVNKKIGTTPNVISSPSSLSHDSGLYSSDQQLYGNECELATSAVAIHKRTSTPPPILPPESPPLLTPTHTTKPVLPFRMKTSPSSPEIKRPPSHPCFEPPVIRVKHSPEIIISSLNIPTSAAFTNDINASVRPYAPPPYQKAVERQLQLRLGVNADSKVNKIAHMPQRNRSSERRGSLTSSSLISNVNEECPDVQPVRPNLRRLQKTPHVEDFEYKDVALPIESSDDVNDVKRSNSHSRTRQLPDELEILLYGEEVSYV